MISKDKGNGNRTIRNSYYNSVYPNSITYSSKVGRYSRYPGIIFIIALLAGLAAGFPFKPGYYNKAERLGRTATQGK